MNAGPTIRLSVFEGPLDLLLHLIKRNEVEITDIPIATITDQYLAMLSELPELNLDGAGEYLVMAATLMYIKSRMLLPTPDGEDEGEEDPRAELVQQLVEYQRYREVAVGLGERQVLGRDVFVTPGEEPEPPPPGEAAPPPVRDASVGDLLEALRTVLERIKPPQAHEIRREQITIRDCVQRILACFALAEEVDFESVFPPDADRGGIIVTFLALLEMIKVRVLRARQNERFGPIVLMLALPSLEEAAARARDLTEMEPWRGGGEADHGSGAGDIVDR